MKMDKCGQVALEYLLIFTVSLLLLIVFTLPLTELTMENALDISDTLEVKSDLSKISFAIQQVYGEGQGSKQSVFINVPKDIGIAVDSNGISTNLKLKNSSNKAIKVNYNSKLPKTGITLKKGQNTLVVEWPVNSKNMKIYKK